MLKKLCEIANRIEEDTILCNRWYNN